MPPRNNDERTSSGPKRSEQAPSMVMFKRAVKRGEISKSIDLVELRKMYISIN